MTRYAITYINDRKQGRAAIVETDRERDDVAEWLLEHTDAVIITGLAEDDNPNATTTTTIRYCI